MDSLVSLFEQFNKPVYFLNGHGCTVCPYSKEYKRNWKTGPPGYKASSRHAYFTVPDNTIILYSMEPGEYLDDQETHYIVRDEYTRPGTVASYLMRHSASDLPAENSPYGRLIRCGPGMTTLDMGIEYRMHKNDMSKSGVFLLGSSVPTLSKKSTVESLLKLDDRPYILVSEVICRILKERPGGGIFIVNSCASFTDIKLNKAVDEYCTQLYLNHNQFASQFDLISSTDGQIFHWLNYLFPLPTHEEPHGVSMCNAYAIDYAATFEENGPTNLGLTSKIVYRDKRGREVLEWIPSD